VGLAVYHDLSIRSGGYFYDRMMVEHLRKRGDEVKVVSIPGTCNGASLINNINPALFRQLSSLDIDILIEDELCHHSLCLLNTRLRKEVDFPLIGLFHYLASSSEWNPIKAHRHQVVERRFLKSLDGCIFNSIGTKDAASQLASLPAWVVARPGKDHVQPKEFVREPTLPLNLLYLGNVTPEKGLHVLITALASIPREMFKLEVGGPITDPSYLDYLWSLIEKFCLHEAVRFRGWVPEDERQQLMERADLLLVPSYFEGYGLAIVEAMAYGLPVIAPLHGGAKDIITSGQEGFLVGPGDQAAISRILSMVLEDPKILMMMSKKARNRYDALPTWGDEMGKVRSFLHRL
jgi:glycosyltransferase involved in cell wall biosynthesis